ncbi:MAG: hypothetical protein LBP40_04680 [Campylobacteraceae bacterium]|jgi:hypothetical protein|nr:hypothetical protein [Campylobacteraceae bacterium]
MTSRIYQIVLFSALTALFFCAFIIYTKNQKIQFLGAELNASVQAKALSEQKTNLLLRELNIQNEAIEKIKIDTERAVNLLINEHKNSAKKWEKELKEAKTCEEKLFLIDELHKKFFKERNNET